MNEKEFTNRKNWKPNDEPDEVQLTVPAGPTFRIKDVTPGRKFQAIMAGTVHDAYSSAFDLFADAAGWAWQRYQRHLKDADDKQPPAQTSDTL